MLKSSRFLSLSLATAGLIAMVALSVSPESTTLAHGNPNADSFGPPDWVVEAWETGEDPVVPEDGPPEWIIESWKSGDRQTGLRSGPPPWVRGAHAKAQERGLAGPPAWVVEAWENGEGQTLGGPPEWVLEALED